MRDLQTDTTVLVSRAFGAAAPRATPIPSSPSVSADGRFVAFESGASNLHPDDGDISLDVFVRDLQADATVLVSRASGVAGAKGNAHSFSASVSADGRFVAFVSGASNLHPDDGVGTQDVLLRDLQADTTVLVSRAAGATGATGNGNSFSASVSADGLFVAFGTDASNLHLHDSDDTQDVFVRDLQAAMTALVSRASGAAGAKGNGVSRSPSVSADGRSVVFVSGASNLHPDDRDSFSDVFARELGPPPLAGPPRLYCEGRRATIAALPGSGRVVGSTRADVIVGSERADRIEGGGGNDRICGRGGRDRIRGGAGHDRLVGGAGNDRIAGGTGNDLVEGGAASDRLNGGAGRDRVRAGSGNDFILTAGVFRDRVDCGPGRDLVLVDRLDRLRHCEDFSAPPGSFAANWLQ